MNAPATPEALRSAWEGMRHRRAFAAWPQDYDQVMADPVFSRLVRLEATGRSRAPSPSPTPVCLSARPFARPALPTLFDRKRAASGERADD